LASGTYNVLVVNASFCEDEADFEVTEPAPLEVNLVDSIASECGEENGLLEVLASGGNGGYTYNWVGAPNGSVIDGIDAGQYAVVVEDEEGCSVETVWDLACIPLVEVEPYTFISPNGDQRNDRWLIDHILLYPESEVWVYNRWGNLVHHASPYLNDWDGTFTEGRKVGEPLPAATYYFVIDTKKKSQDLVKGFLEIQTSAQ
jgi:gliding motility-associated-like protein